MEISIWQHNVNSQNKFLFIKQARKPQISSNVCKFVQNLGYFLESQKPKCWKPSHHESGINGFFWRTNMSKRLQEGMCVTNFKKHGNNFYLWSAETYIKFFKNSQNLFSGLGSVLFLWSRLGLSTMFI